MRLSRLSLLEVRILIVVALVSGAQIASAQPAQLDERTIQERLSKQAAHFRQGTPKQPPLEQMALNADGVVEFQPLMINDYMMRSPPLTPVQELEETAIHSDAILIGTTVKRYSAANARHTALYSDWVVKVTKVYKNKSTVEAQVGGEVTIARTGGDLWINGRHVIYREEWFSEFEPDHTYVFYLRADPDSSSFFANGGATFDITGEKPILFAEPKNPTSMKSFALSSTAGFLKEVANTAR
jgi:hypothetical protein